MDTSKLVEKAPTPKKPRGEQRVWGVYLTDPAGNELAVFVERAKAGWRTYARHAAGAGKARKVARGASAQHPDEKAARAAQAALVASAEKAGWRRREARPGFAPRPDAFTAASLPKPGSKK
jgi:hypothetical protein